MFPEILQSTCSRRVAIVGLGLVPGLARQKLAHASSEDEAAGGRLAQALFYRPVGRNLTTRVRMELVERGRQPRVRELVTYRSSRGNGESTTLIRFLAPRDVAGTGLLTLTRADASDDQLLYLPALDRVRRISSDRRGGRFVGSDIYYEDLQERRPDADLHRIVGRERVGEVECERLLSLPRDRTDSVYRRRLSWVDPLTLLPHRVDYFERDEHEPSKRWELLGHQRIQGFWTITDSRVSDLNSGHFTRMQVLQAIYDRRLPERLFTPQALADEAMESPFRP